MAESDSYFIFLREFLIETKENPLHSIQVFLRQALDVRNQRISAWRKPESILPTQLMKLFRCHAN